MTTDRLPINDAEFRARMEQLTTSSGVSDEDIARIADGIRAMADRTVCAYNIGVCACDRRPGCQAP